MHVTALSFLARLGCRSGKADVLCASCRELRVTFLPAQSDCSVRILELTSFTLPVFRAKHLNTVYRYKVGVQRTFVLRDDLTVSGQ